MLTIEIGNTSTARVSGVKNNLTGEIDDGATLLFTLYEKDGTTPVTGQIWPAPMYNEPGGIYACTIESDVELKLNWLYVARVDGTGSNGEVMDINEKVTAVTRGTAC